MAKNAALAHPRQMAHTKSAQSGPSPRRGGDPGDLKTSLSVDQLAGVNSPRLTGVNRAHARLLADLDEPLPPIVVQRSSMHVIDGMHRVEAARLRGDRHIDVTFVNYTDEEAFVIAVKLNSAHGLPLSAEERNAATTRILRYYPEWSDRRIASICGVAPRTVAALRCSTDDSHQSNKRTGRDGRLRPVSAEEGRKAAAEYVKEHPEAPLREIARAAGISVGTALDVRRKFRKESSASSTGETALTVGTEGQSALPEGGGTGTRRPGQSAAPPGDTTSSVDTKLSALARDPSLRYTQQGRALLRLMHETLAFTAQPDAAARSLPQHCRESISDVARACADRWRELAGAVGSQ